MLLKSFLPSNLLSSCIRIINSVVVLGLYYGFLTTFSIGPSYLLLLQTGVMEEGEEGIEKKVAATTGFIAGKLMMFISIYYAPLHLALGRPHTITVLALPYLLFHFFWSNHKDFFDYGFTTRNSMRNIGLQCVFLNHLIFQLFNHFIFPSSMLARLVNIYMFRCNNKMLFVTSSFVGWLIGHILFMKWVGLVLVWIQQKLFLRSNVLIRSNKYLVSKFQNNVGRIFSILLFITSVYSLGRIPSPLFTNKLKGIVENEEEEKGESEEEGDIKRKGDKQEQEVSTKEDPFSDLFSDSKKEEELLEVEKPLVTVLFDYNRWTRPFRYIKNDRFENAIKNEMSQYFFYTCQSDGKEKISFTYPPSLATFRDIIEEKISFLTPEKLFSDELDTDWSFTNELKRRNLSKEFINRVESLDKESFDLSILEKKTRLSNFSNNETKKDYVLKIYDPFLDGPDRVTIENFFSDGPDGVTIENFFSPSSINTTSKTEEPVWINKIYALLFAADYHEFEQTIDTLKRKSLSTEKDLSLLTEDEQGNINDEDEQGNINDEINEIIGEINEISKKVPEWSYKLMDDLEFDLEFQKEEEEEEEDDEDAEDEQNKEDEKNKKKKQKTQPEIRSRQYRRLVIYTINDPKTKKANKENANTENANTKNANTENANTKNANTDNANTDNANTENANTKNANTDNANTDNANTDNANTENANTENANTENANTNNANTENANTKNANTENVNTKNANTENANTKNANTDNANTEDANTKDDKDEPEEVALIHYAEQSDFSRDIIRGPRRPLRRKTVPWELFQANVHSPLFLDRIDKPLFFSFDISGLMKLISQNWIAKNKESKISTYTTTTTEKKTNKIDKEDRREKYEIEEKRRIEIAQAWDNIEPAQALRGCMLLTQSILRKYIILPSLIIAKNISRMLLFQVPEWSEDFKDWNQEMHVKCTYNGAQLSETEFPQNWLTDGIQIKILFPFCLQPWRKLKRQSSPKDPIKKKKGQKNDFCFLTVWGLETEQPFGSPRNRRSFFGPIFKELKKANKKLKTKWFIALTIFKERTKLVLFPKVSKEAKKWITKSILFLKRIRKELSKINQILFFGLRKIDDLGETKKDSIISNKMIHEFALQTQSMEYSLTEKKINDLTKKTNTIKNQVEKIRKDKKNKFLTQELNINSNKRSYQDKIVKSSKKILQILKKRNKRLIRKLYLNIKLCIQRIYMDILLDLYNTRRRHIEEFRVMKKIIDKFIYNTEANQEKIRKTNKNAIHFISTIKNSLSSIRNQNAKAFCDLSPLSQAYVFYKLSQNQIISFYKFKPILEYHGTSLFLKNEIKDYFEKQGISHSRLRHHYGLRQKSFWHSGMNELKNWLRGHDLSMNEWKNWLRGHYQYDLPKDRWLRLVPGQWRNRVTQHCMAQSKDLTKWDSYEKEGLIHLNSLLNEKYKLKQKYKKDNFKKHYGYDILSYKSINYQDKRDSYTYESPLQVNKKEAIYYNYNIEKQKILEDIMDTRRKFSNRKYFNWRILNFCLRNKADIESWAVNNYQRIDKINNNKRGLFFYWTMSQDQNEENKPVLSNKKRSLFDWMGMNEEILNPRISNLELWFFPEFRLLYNAYKVKPWIIPIKLLLFDGSENENINKKIIEKKKGKEDEKKKGGKEEEEKKKGKEDEKKKGGKEEEEKKKGGKEEEEKKKGKEDSGKSKKKKKKKTKEKTEQELAVELFLARYLGLQFRWDDSEKIMNFIKLGSLLLRLININEEIVISSIQRGEMNLELFLFSESLTPKEIMTSGILILEPMRLSVQNDGQFIIYQTISISLVHKKKDEMKQRYQKYKKNSDESIARHQKMTENKDKNHYDLFVPENILSPKRRRELRILISFNSRDKNGMDRNAVFLNNVKNSGQVLSKNKHLDSDKKKLIKLKFFLWPNYRLEDLACMNRYWFNTNNGSRFSMVRIHMYPRLQTR